MSLLPSPLAASRSAKYSSAISLKDGLSDGLRCTLRLSSLKAGVRGSARSAADRADNGCSTGIGVAGRAKACTRRSSRRRSSSWRTRVLASGTCVDDCPAIPCDGLCLQHLRVVDDERIAGCALRKLAVDLDQPLDPGESCDLAGWRRRGGPLDDLEHSLEVA